MLKFVAGTFMVCTLALGSVAFGEEGKAADGAEKKDGTCCVEKKACCEGTKEEKKACCDAKGEKKDEAKADTKAE